jgi:hypothetical protein
LASKKADLQGHPAIGFSWALHASSSHEKSLLAA